MTDINFDQFKQEIRVAENYLRVATSRSTNSENNLSSKVRASADGLVVLDATRKESILQQFGRRSLASSQELASRVYWKIDDSEDKAVHDRSTFDGASVSSDPFWKEGGRSNSHSSNERLASDDQAFGRYSSRSEREKLINRLLTDHDTKNLGMLASEVLPTSNYLNDSQDSDEIKRLSAKQNSSRAEYAHPPDSLNTSSDDDSPDSLFFASDINISTEYGQRSQRLASSIALDVDPVTSYQLESPDVINVNYSVQDDAFARLNRSEMRQTSDIKSSKEWNMSGSDMHDEIPGTSSNSGRDGDITPKEELFPSTKTFGFDHSAHEMATRVGSSSLHRYRKSPQDEISVDAIDLDAAKLEVSLKKAVIKKKFHKTKEQLQKEAEAAFQKLYAFKPTIISDDRRSTGRRDASGTERVEAIQKWYKRSREEREKQKMDFLHIELMNCTFQPQIIRSREGPSKMVKLRNPGGFSQFNAVEYLSGGTGYSSKEQLEGSRNSGEVSMRLYNDAEQRSTQQRWLERQVEEARLAQFTFQPSINPVTTSYSDTIEYKPIYERVGELQKEKEDRMRTLKQSHQDSQVDLTFTPSIDPRSRRIAVKKLEDEDTQQASSSSCSIATSEVSEGHSRPVQQYDVGSRLHREARLAAKRKQQLCARREQLEIMEMEHPRLSRGTEKLALQSSKVGYARFHFSVHRQWH